MDNQCLCILQQLGIDLKEDETLVPRSVFLQTHLYEAMQKRGEIDALKKIFSSSSMTALHKTAAIEQSWPLLNMVRQILHVYGYHMKPIRKSDGYNTEGVKKYKRFFMISKKVSSSL